jgi:hypothetical protein
MPDDNSGFNDSRAQKTSLDVTRTGHPGDVASGDPTDGESSGVGTKYMAILVERTNKSNPRNQGPTRPSANTGTIPTVAMSVRKTGQI